MFNPIISLDIRLFAHFFQLLLPSRFPPQPSPNFIWFVINKAKPFDLQFGSIPKLVSLAGAIAFPIQQLPLRSMLNGALNCQDQHLNQA